jgi:hypothetical protein
MRVFVAGGSGTIGIPLVRALIAAGHRVVATTRSPDKQTILRGLGAIPVVVDALDAAALERAVRSAAPTHVIHQLTALPRAGPRRASDLEPTNRLRDEGTRNSYGEIGSILNTSEANCRQLLHRAKQRLAGAKPHSSVSRQEKRHLAERFADAMLGGDGAELTRVLAEDVGFWGDGGGRVPTAKRPVLGRDKVVELLLGIRRTAQAAGIPLEKVSVEVVEINFDPATVVRVDGRLDSVYVCTIVRDGISGIRVVRNPDKLVYIDRQLGERTPTRRMS